MKTIKLILIMILVTAIVTVFLQSCDKDESPDPLTVVSVVTDEGVTIDGAGTTTNIPVNTSLIITFDKEINASTVNESSVIILDNGVDVPSTLTVDGSTITIKPITTIKTGRVHAVSVTSAVAASDGSVAKPEEFSFTSIGRAVIAPPQAANQLSYFSFNGEVRDEAGTHTPSAQNVRDIAYATDRFGFAELASDFNGTTSIIEVPNGNQYMIDNSTSVSVWVKMNSTKAGQYILGLGAWKGFHLEMDADWAWVNFVSHFSSPNFQDSEDNKFTGSGLTKDNGGWQGCIFHKEVLPQEDGAVGTLYFKDKWAHVVSTYNATTKVGTLYINGEKMRQFDFDLWPTEDPKKLTTGIIFGGNLTDGGNTLALGFIQGSQNRIVTAPWADPANIYSYHYLGQMDDLRIFKIALTETEVATLYTAEKP